MNQDDVRAAPIECGAQNQLVAAKHGWMLVNKNDVYIGRSVKETGEFSEGEVAVFDQFLRPGAVVIEAGANIGTHTVPLAKMVGEQGRVYAFEPQRIIFQILCANLALNSITNVRALWSGLGSEESTFSLPAIDYSVTQNFGGVNFEKFDTGEEVPVSTIDKLDLPRVDLVKADVEGMELAVLQRGNNTIERCRPMLYLECDREDRSQELIEHLYAQGYKAYWHRPLLFNPNNYFGNSENPFGNIVSINILAVHQERKINIEGLPPVELPA